MITSPLKFIKYKSYDLSDFKSLLNDKVGQTSKYKSLTLKEGNSSFTQNENPIF